MSKPSYDSPDHIAVVGVSALFPGSAGGQSFWRNILAAEDFMQDIPANHWLTEDYYDEDQSRVGKTYATRGAFLPKVDFDPMEFGMPPNQLSSTDTAQLLALIVAKKVLEDALSVQFEKVDPRNVSVILGVASATELVGQMAGKIQRPHWVKALRDAGLPESKVQEVCDGIEKTYPEWNESTFPGLLGNVVAGRIANRLNLGGTNCVIDAACASSLGSVSMAIQELQLGHSDLVITGGVDALNDIFMYMCFSKTPALSPTGDCRPFSDKADGTMLGEGIGMVALRRLKDAERDGDKIYAVIRGIGSSSDGRAKSIYAPRAEGQELAIRRAYEHAGYGVDEVGLIEAHGTATKAGDVAEFNGLRGAFGDSIRTDRQWCALGSVKSQIGHTKSAAGAASLFKIVMALHHKVLPPTIKVDQPNPALEIENSPFYLNTEARPWIQMPGITRKGSVSAFGFGGSNFHLAVEEYIGENDANLRHHNAPKELLLISGESVAKLETAIAELNDNLKVKQFADVARACQENFDSNAMHRLAVIAKNADEFQQTADKAITSIEAHPEETFSLPNRMHYGFGMERPAVGFLFPGQGSQYVNMGSKLAMEFDAARRVWDEVSGIEMEADKRLDQVVFPIPVFSDAEREAQQELLTRTHWAQPAIGCVSLSMLKILETLDVKPAAVAGHSYGELTALYAANAVASTADLVSISRKRGELMTEAAETPGSMTAVKASAEKLQQLLEACDANITISNINSPSQVVIAGSTEEIEKAEAMLAEAGTKFRRLPVATAFHTELVSGCAEPFYEYLAELPIGTPEIPVYANTTAAVYPNEPDEVRRTLAWQLANPVRFQEILERMYDDGIRVFVEVGPNSLLSGMVRDTLKGRDHEMVSMDSRRQDGRISLWNTLGVLSVNAVKLDYASLWAEFALCETLTDIENQSPVTVQLDGANYGKPYPPESGAAGRSEPNPELPETILQPQSSSVSESVNNSQTQPGTASDPVVAVRGVAERPASDPNWASAFSVLQQQTVEAQKAFQQTLSESHEAFLRASEVAFTQLGQMAGVPPSVSPIQTPGVQAADQVAESPIAQSTVQSLPTSASEQPRLAVTEPSVALPPTDVTPNSAVDFEGLLLGVVSDKTGYPVEMLSLDMELEAGLGIDSIKRVEILSVLQELLPHLGDIDTAELAELNTLGEILEFASQSALPTTLASTDLVDASTAAVDFETVDFEAVLLAVVSDKTGYPVEMLSLDMELEAGLGIDSIKRVEILSVLQEQLPHLGEIDTAELAELNTLGEILEFASNTGGAAPQQQGAKKPPEEVPEKEWTSATADPHIMRYAVRCVDSPATGIAMGGLLESEIIYIVKGNRGVAEPLSNKLSSAGIDCEIVSELPYTAKAVILLNGLDLADSAEAYAVFNSTAFRTIGQCAESMSADGKLFVTVQDTGGDFGLSGGAGVRAYTSGLAALAKTAALEWQNTSVKAIDIDMADRSAETIAEQVFQELVSGGSQIEVGLQSDGKRVTLEAVSVEERGESTSLCSDDVFVVTGGARGVTAACIQELMSRTPAKIAILGRTTLGDEPAGVADARTDPELKKILLKKHQDLGESIAPLELNAEVRRILAMREVRQNLANLKATGATVRYDSVDVADKEAVKSAIRAIESDLGPVTGVIHAAGVLADKHIHEKTAEQFDLVFGTKVGGFINLLEALESADLKHIICFSSVAARTGNIGQVDYAMANEVLNRVCRSEGVRRGGSCQTKSFGWGPWDGGMVDPGLKKHFTAMGVALIPLDQGARLFADEVEGRLSADTEIVLGGDFKNRLLSCDSSSWGIWVHESLQPLIHSHVIRGVPVIPVLLVNEWFMQIAKELYPDLQVRRTVDLKVLKGMQATNFTTTGDWFKVVCKDTSTPDSLAVQIEDRTGTIYYQATLELGKRDKGPGPKLPVADLAMDAWNWDAGTVYHEHLFHGPDFQVIRELQGISEAGCVGILQASASLPGPVKSLESDVAVLDGGLQLALLWERNRSGHASLPTGFESLSIFKTPPYAGPVKCLLQCRSATSLGVEWSLVFTDIAGDVIAEMERVSMHVLPDAPSEEKAEENAQRVSA